MKWFAVVLVSALLFGFVQAVSAEYCSICGVVKRSDTGLGVNGATVKVNDAVACTTCYGYVSWGTPYTGDGCYFISCGVSGIHFCQPTNTIKANKLIGGKNYRGSVSGVNAHHNVDCPDVYPRADFTISPYDQEEQ